MVQPNASARALDPKPGDKKSTVASMVESIVGCKWSLRLIEVIAKGPTRPSALLRACPRLSAKVMNERLRKMTRFGILRRSVVGEKPPIEVEYRLTRLGRRFTGILAEVRRLQESIDRGDMSESEGGATSDGRLTTGLSGPAAEPER